MAISLQSAILASAVFCAANATGGEPVVRESARQIPVAYSVDVVVVGGSTGAVAAAAEAARQGARVFLAAPRPYLGEDMTATLRLWLEEGEEPTTALARRIFEDDAGRQDDPRALPFTYHTDRPSSAAHKDTDPPSLLADSRWGSPQQESVEYGGDVTVLADLGDLRPVDEIRVMLYDRRSKPPGSDYRVKHVTAFTSSDGQNWREVGRAGQVEERVLRSDQQQTQKSVLLSVPVGADARYVKLAVEKADDAGRILLGEVAVLAPQGTKIAPSRVLRLPRPLHVKRALDDALLETGVEFLYGCVATDVLRDGQGRPAGIVMANRSGRQAVMAKVIVDATDRAWVARMAGAQSRPFPAGELSFRRVVIGGEPRTGEGLSARRLEQRLFSGGRAYEMIEYTLAIAMRDGSFASFAEAEQVARDRTFDPQQFDASEKLFQVPPDPLHSAATLEGDWPGTDQIDANVFRPAGVPRIYVLSGSADVPRPAAERLLRPVTLMELGQRMGGLAAAEAAGLAAPEGVVLPGDEENPITDGDVRELLDGAGPLRKDLSTVAVEARSVAVLGRYDVVVIGGGTSGAPAGIGAARRGAKTLVVEYQHSLGGVGTLGLIGRYHRGRRVGFTAEIDQALEEMKPAVYVVGKAEHWRRANRQSGAEIWLATLGCGAFVEDGRVKGAVVATPAGRGVVLADVVIDATGNADVAAAAGAPCVFVEGSHIAMQGTGLPPYNLGASYTNTDFAFADDSDPVDTWRLMVWAKRQEPFRGAYDLGQLVDTRERRRILGDYLLSPLDELIGRTFPDSITLSQSNFDTHGYTVHPLFLLRPTRRDHGSPQVYTPYRCLIPKELEGMLVTGLGVSAHRDAMPFIRMQPDLQNQGYAAGVAAAMAAAGSKGVRQIDVETLQRHLVEIGSLPESALTDGDSFPLPEERIAAAVKAVVEDRNVLPVILIQPEASIPMLREAYRTADAPDAKLLYAQILGVMGDASGVETLAAAVEASSWDEGWDFEGMGAYDCPLSPVDALIIALGRTRSQRALEPILAKLDRLDADQPLSHHRAVAIGLEALRDPRAAEPLARLLSQPEMAGHAVRDLQDALERPVLNTSRHPYSNDSLREIVLARALYRCGDWQAVGEKILREYQRDLRGVFARHARALLHLRPGD